MRRWITRQDLMPGLLVAAALAAGCDADSFAPPAPGRSRSSASPSGALPARAKEVVMVLPAEENADLALYDLIGRNEAGLSKVVFRVARPSPGAPASAQAELIKQAAADGASTLIVVPDATKETADSLAALDPRKTPVVLLGRSPSGPPLASATRVAFQGFDVSAKAIASAIVGAEKTLGFKPDAAAILVSVTPADETGAERNAALAAALKEAKVPIVATVTTTSDTAAAQKTLAEAVKGRPEVHVLVGDDEAAIIASNAMRTEFPNRKFLVAGYFMGRNNYQSLMSGRIAALAERSVETLVRQTVRLAVDRAEGKDVPAKVAVEITIRPGNATAPGPEPVLPTVKEATAQGADARKAAEPDAKKPAPEAKKEK